MTTYLAESRVRSSGGKGKKTNYLNIYCYDRADPTLLAKKYLSERGQFHDTAKPVFDGEPPSDQTTGWKSPFSSFSSSRKTSQRSSTRSSAESRKSLKRKVQVSVLVEGLAPCSSCGRGWLFQAARYLPSMFACVVRMLMFTLSRKLMRFMCFLHIMWRIRSSVRVLS